jgi:hypothetical protein
MENGSSPFMVLRKNCVLLCAIVAEKMELFINFCWKYSISNLKTFLQTIMGRYLDVAFT